MTPLPPRWPWATAGCGYILQCWVRPLQGSHESFAGVRKQFYATVWRLKYLYYDFATCTPWYTSGFQAFFSQRDLGISSKTMRANRGTKNVWNETWFLRFSVVEAKSSCLLGLRLMYDDLTIHTSTPGRLAQICISRCSECFVRKT